jgi:alcohol dehydrogenase class IV
VFETPDDVEARASLLLASLEGGILLATCGTVVVHALGYQLTKAFGYRHGEVNALMLGAFVERLAQRGSDRAHLILDVFDGDLTGFVRSCGIEPDRSFESVASSDLASWIDAGWNAYGRRNAVVPLDRDDIRTILHSAFR